jgi:uncharacterized protein
MKFLSGIVLNLEIYNLKQFRVLPMFKKSAIFLFLLFSLCTAFVNGQGNENDFPPRPNPPRLINDLAMKLSREEVQALEAKLLAYSDSTSTQIAIVVVKSIGSYEISQYASELAMRWQIGVKGKNNGMLILWSTGERKIYIATGYGLEEKVPDAIAKRIVNQLIIPNFKLGAYYQGLNMATDEVISRLSGTFEADEQAGNEEFPFEFFLIMLFMMLFIIYMIRRNGGRGNRFNDNNRGGFGGGGGMPWIISSGGGSGWGGSGGGSWGGGDSGGGFGGFGGGDFGGGGAGGDY